MYDPLALFKKHTLSNGVDVYFQYTDRPWIYVHAIVHAGAAEDKLDKLGTAHFLEHLVSENIPGISNEKCREIFEQSGGNVMLGCTNYHATKYQFFIPTDKELLGNALSIFGAMLFSAKIENHIEQERQIIIREFYRRFRFKEEFDWAKKIQQQVFSGHRAEHHVRALGTIESINSINQTDLQGFYDRYYVPQNISLVILGGIPECEMIKMLEESNLALKKSGSRNVMPPVCDLPPNPLEKELIVTMSEYSSMKIDRSDYVAKWSLTGDTTAIELTVLKDVLYEILYKKIRVDKSLTYSISIPLYDFKNVQSFEIRMQIKTGSVSEVDQIVQEAISSVQEDKDLFLKKIKQQILTKQLLDCSGSEILENATTSIGMRQEITTVMDDLNELVNLTHERIVSLSKLLSQERKYLFVIIP